MSNSIETLNRLLADGRKYSAEYRGALSNHLPMTLIALAKLGASAERLIAFAKDYAKKLDPTNSPEMTISPENWRSEIGKHKFHAEYVAFFTEEFQAKGKAACLKNYLDFFMKGVGGGAFHPLIRLGYAIEMESDSEVIESLAAFAMAHMPLGGEIESAEKCGPVEILEQIRVNSAFPEKIEGPNVFSRMKIGAEIAAFARVKDSLDAESVEVADFAEAVLTLYLSTDDNFTALHAVTSTHALRNVLPFIANKAEAYAYFWQAIAAAYISTGKPELVQTNVPASLPSWEAIKERAIESPNDHVIKFVYTCFAEFAVYEDRRYQFAAARKAGILE